MNRFEYPAKQLTKIQAIEKVIPALAIQRPAFSKAVKRSITVISVDADCFSKMLLISPNDLSTELRCLPIEVATAALTDLISFVFANVIPVNKFELQLRVAKVLDFFLQQRKILAEVYPYFEPGLWRPNVIVEVAADLRPNVIYEATLHGYLEEELCLHEISKLSSFGDRRRPTPGSSVITQAMLSDLSEKLCEIRRKRFAVLCSLEMPDRPPMFQSLASVSNLMNNYSPEENVKRLEEIVRVWMMWAVAHSLSL